MRAVIAMPTMFAMTVEEVEKRAGEQQDVREILENVRAVLGDEEECCDRKESPEHPSARHSLVRRSRKALLTTDTELIAIAAPAKIGESSTPNTG